MKNLILSVHIRGHRALFTNMYYRPGYTDYQENSGARKAIHQIIGLRRTSFAQGYGEPFDFAHGASNGAEQRRSASLAKGGTRQIISVLSGLSWPGIA